MTSAEQDPARSDAHPREHGSPVVRALFFVAGVASLGFAVAGIFLPVLPTTPLVLLAAACFARSYRPFHEWIVAHRLFGPMVRELTRIHEQARDGLRDIRRSLRELRSVEAERATGLKALYKITKIFGEATGVDVQMQLGNALWDFGDEANALLCRIVQEGLTNSYRHGGATRVVISLWVETNVLHVAVHDNGRGSAEIVPGIGLSAMKERVQQMKGEVEVASSPDGFTLVAKIPLQNRPSHG